MKRFVAVHVILLLSAAACGTPADFKTGLAAYERGDYAAAYGEFLPLAERGHAEAQYHLGLMYFGGRGVPWSDAPAAAWFRKAAEQGYAKAQYNLGLMYNFGWGVAESGAQAETWYRKAAEQGHALAQYYLGLMYFEGRGVPQDDVRAAAWYLRFLKSAERGDAEAQDHLAIMHAQYQLGLMYAEGRGVPQNDAQAAACRRIMPKPWRGTARPPGGVLTPSRV